MSSPPHIENGDDAGSDYDSFSEINVPESSQGKTAQYNAQELLDRYFSTQAAKSPSGQRLVEAIRVSPKDPSDQRGLSNTSTSIASSSTSTDPQLYSLLKELNLLHYLSKFQSEEITYNDLKDLSLDDLKEMGLPIGPRKRLLSTIEIRFNTLGGQVTPSPIRKINSISSSADYDNDRKVSFSPIVSRSPVIQSPELPPRKHLMVQTNSSSSSSSNQSSAKTRDNRSGTVGLYDALSKGSNAVVEISSSTNRSQNNNDKDISIESSSEAEVQLDFESDNEGEEEGEEEQQEQEPEEQRQQKRNIQLNETIKRVSGTSPALKGIRKSSSSSLDETRPSPSSSKTLRISSTVTSSSSSDSPSTESINTKAFFASTSSKAKAIKDGMDLLGSDRDDACITLPSHCVPYLTIQSSDSSTSDKGSSDSKSSEKKVFSLKPDRVTSIGRSSANEISILDVTMSRKHSVVHFKDKKVVISDNNSSGGTLINGKRLRSSQYYFLKRGDKITCGKTVFLFGFNLATFKGYLELKGENKLKVPTWSRRWCILKSSKLYYFTSKEDTTKGKCINLSEVTSVDEGDEVNSPTSIHLKSDTRTWTFRAPSRQERKLWAKGFRDHVTETGRGQETKKIKRGSNIVRK